MQSNKRKISKTHIQKLWSESGLSQETILDAELTTVTQEEAINIIGHGGSGICFTYHNTEGNQIGHRIKQDDPRVDDKGKPQKYLTSTGSDAFVYFLKNDIERLLTSEQVIIVEGEKKLLKIRQDLKAINIPMAAIAGCWMFRKSEQARDELHSVLDRILSEKKTVTLIPDSDYFANINVCIAYNNLAKIICRKGIAVNLIDIRLPNDNTKIGVDDFLMKAASEELLKRIKTPLYTFKMFSEEEIMLNSKEITPGRVENALSSLVFLPVADVEAQLNMIKKAFGVKVSTLKSVIAQIRTKFPLSVPSRAEVEWNQSTETIQVFCKKIGDLIQKRENYFFDESIPPKLVIPSENLKTMKRISSSEELLAFLNSTISFRKIHINEDGQVKANVFETLPRDVVGALHSSLPNFASLPTLSHVSSTPQMINGQLLIKQGFHEEHGVMIQGDFNIEADRTTKLKEFLSTIPFATETDKANFLGILISSTFFMHEYAGGFLALIINASHPGTGKTTLAKCIEYLIDEKNAGTCSLKEDGELEKEVATRTKESNVVIFDNIRKQSIQSPLLERLLTDEVLAFRKFHTQDAIRRRNAIQFIFTMNGGSMSIDLLDRCILVELDKKKLNKASGIDPLAFVKANRNHIIQELVVMVQEFQRTGCSVSVQGSEPRFERWARLVNSILHANGIKGFLGNNDKFKSSFDDVVNAVLNIAIRTADRSPFRFKAKEIIDSHHRKNFDPEARLSAHAIGKRLSNYLDSEFLFQAYDGQKYQVRIHRELFTLGGGSNNCYVLHFDDPETSSVISVDSISSNEEEVKLVDMNVFKSSLSELKGMNHENHDPFLEPGQVLVSPVRA